MGQQNPVGTSGIRPGVLKAAKSIYQLKNLAALTVALGMALPAAAHDDGWSRADADIEPAINMAANDPEADAQISQFALPKKRKGAKKGAPLLPRVLPISYTYGAEFETPYYHNRDLDNDRQDDTLLAAPTMFGSLTYRPASWLEFMVEGTLEKLISVREEETTVLPDGTTQQRDPKPWSLQIDLLNAKVRIPSQPLDVTLGRAGYRDPRLWVYDGEGDGVFTTYKPGNFTIEASVSRQEAVDLDLLTHVPRQHTNDYMLYTRYRGIEDLNLAGYFILRDHPASAGEGRPQFMGLSALGRPSDAFNWWTQLGYVDGRDEDEKSLSGYGFDVGGTYRFLKTWLQPSITLGFAYGSGDGDATDNENSEYRQTGLHSNEGRFGGVSDFLYYGEALNPELSNLQIYTAGVSVRPASGMFVDFVYHHYRLNEIDTEIRNSELTATMNDDSSKHSKDVGNEVDIVIGFRRMFGIRRLGSEIKAGVFFPGDAWDSTPNSDKAISFLFVIFI